MDVNQMMVQALDLMGIGVGLVFLVLTVFFFCIKLMVKLFPVKDE